MRRIILFVTAAVTVGFGSTAASTIQVTAHSHSAAPAVVQTAGQRTGELNPLNVCWGYQCPPGT